jgi:hypothetical protein
MLTSIHFLLTYACNFECDHCFLFSGPGAGGTFGVVQLRAALEETAQIGTIDSVFFEGGEPMLYFPLLAEGLRTAKRLGLTTGVVTNGYWATSREDARIWLQALQEAGLDSLTLSDDPLHYEDAAGTHSSRVQAAAKELNMPADVICTQRPTVEVDGVQGHGETLVAGGVKFRGRAALKLAPGLPGRPWQELSTCPFEDLAEPGRVHADCYGNMHLCQGVSMGSFRDRSMKNVVDEYDPAAHPVAGPLIAGGPAELARHHRLPHEERYVDECHLCFEMRLALRSQFKELLAPAQVYGERPDRPPL